MPVDPRTAAAEAAEKWQVDSVSRCSHGLRNGAACPDCLAALLLAWHRRGEEDMRERAAKDCDERAILNASVEGPRQLCKDFQTGVVASAYGHRAIEARECAFSIRALPLGET